MGKEDRFPISDCLLGLDFDAVFDCYCPRPQSKEARVLRNLFADLLLLQNGKRIKNKYLVRDDIFTFTGLEMRISPEQIWREAYGREPTQKQRENVVKMLEELGGRNHYIEINIGRYSMQRCNPFEIKWMKIVDDVMGENRRELELYSLEFLPFHLNITLNNEPNF